MNFIGEYQIDREVAKDVAKLFKSLPELHTPGRVGNGRIDKTEKDSTEIDFGLLDGRPEITAYFDELNGRCLPKYKEQFEYSNKLQYYWNITETGNIQCYRPGGGFFKYHFENSGCSDEIRRRHLAFMTYLCDIPIEEGGGTEFLYQNKVYECSLGRTLIWPAIWTHTHRGIPSHTMEKLIITGWFSYIPN